MSEGNQNKKGLIRMNVDRIMSVYIADEDGTEMLISEGVKKIGEAKRILKERGIHNKDVGVVFPDKKTYKRYMREVFFAKHGMTREEYYHAEQILNQARKLVKELKRFPDGKHLQEIFKGQMTMLWSDIDGARMGCADVLGMVIKKAEQFLGKKENENGDAEEEEV